MFSLKDINKKRIKIKRGEQQQIGVNLEIKQSLKEEAGENETYAETLNRILTTKHQMTDLLVTLVENMNETPTKMTDLLSVLPVGLKNLMEAVLNERESEK